MIHTIDDQAIIAQCTPRGTGALALVRISGQKAVTFADRFSSLSSKKSLKDCPSHTIHHGYVVDKYGKKIDEVLFFLMRGPRTFTGQDTIEISCHNNPFIIESVIERAIQCGARRAKPGEFTKRSFLSGKIDLVQAEAIHDVISAHSEYALRASMAQLEGSLSSYLVRLEEQVMEVFSLCQASFEFLDEEQRDLDFDVVIRNKIASIRSAIENALQGYDQQQHIKDGVRVALIGTVNAGKSTLFNAFLGKDRAIVTDRAGTTRDSIEAQRRAKDTYWLLVDTAGLRQTNDAVEQIGIKRSWQEAEKADIILLVIDGTSSLLPEAKKLYQEVQEKFLEKCIVVLNKVDEKQNDTTVSFAHQLTDNVLSVSGKQQTGIVPLEQVIATKIQELFKHLRSPFLLNQRQYSLLCEMKIKMQDLVKSIDDDIGYELVAFHLRDVLEGFVELTGRAIDEKMMDTIFNQFCIGK